MGSLGQLTRTVEGRRRLGGLLVLVAAVGAISFLLWRHYAASESTDDAQVDGHINPVATRVAGTVEAVEVKDNQEVKTGQVLVRIDPQDYQVALERAEADLADARAAAAAAQAGVPIVTASSTGQLVAARAAVEQAEAGTVVAQREIDVARAKLRAAQARLRQATVEADRVGRDRERLEPLMAKDEVARQQFDAAVAAAEAARAAVDSAHAAVAQEEQGVAVAESRDVQARGTLEKARADLRSAETAPQQVSATRARATAADARVQTAEAAVKQARLMLDYTTIVAPVSGIVSRKSVEVGQVVQPGQLLLAVVPLGNVWVTANFKETQVADMRPGQAATVRVDAFPGEFAGRVDSIAAATGARFSLLPPENASGNYVKIVQRVPVKIVLEHEQQPGRVLRPGMSVVARVQTQ